MLTVSLLALLLVGGVAAWKFLPRTLSHDECSEVYRYFADMRLEGVSVTYVRDKVINDTLRLPVTLLQAENDAGWAALDSLFGITEDRNTLLNDATLPDKVKVTHFLPYFSIQRTYRKTPDKKIEPGDVRPDDVIVYIFPDMRCVIIYETYHWKAIFKVATDHIINLDDADSCHGHDMPNE